MGQPALLDKIRNHLGIEPGETTEDGRFTLMGVECLGSCGTAPCALVNHKLHENITAENFQKVLDSLE
jgi:NADH-quinone oxidoreductase subunit E